MISTYSYGRQHSRWLSHSCPSAVLDVSRTPWCGDGGDVVVVVYAAVPLQLPFLWPQFVVIVAAAMLFVCFRYPSAARDVMVSMPSMIRIIQKLVSFGC